MADDSQVIVNLLPPAVIIESPARCPPPAAIVAGGRPLVVQPLVRTSRCHGLLQEAMQVRDASFNSTHAYASMPPDEAETEGRGCGGGMQRRAGQGTIG